MHRIVPRLRFALAFMLLAPVWAGNATASSQNPLMLPRLHGEIHLDGFSDEPAWQAIEPLPMTMFQPVFGGEMTERTEVRIAYDDQYLYVSGRLYDSDPEGIRGNTLYRDRYSGDDVFAIILDTFNDNENALWFFTTPNGVRFDMAVSNDAEFGGGSPFGGVINASWNTFWDVATARTDEGWFAEMRIPYSSLGFQDQDGDVTMGMIVYRFIARKNERHIFPAIPPNWGMAFAKPSQAQDIVLKGVHSQKPLYVTPYVLGGLGQASELDATGARYRLNNDVTRNVGLDVKYSLTSNLTLDATINTDFAQVEADDQQVNLTRFSLFFPEKRQFFQERAGIFDFSTGRVDRLFHSRRIGLDRGEEVRILGGTRLVGRVGGWDVGFIDMQTERTTLETSDGFDTIPSENFGVLRLRRQVFNENSYAGGMATSRIGDDGSYNVAYGLDGIFRVFGQDYLTLQWAQSIEDDVVRAQAFDFFDTGLFRARWQRRGQQGLTYTAALTRSGADYNPGIGFVTRRAFTQPFGALSYGWFPEGDTPVRRVTPRAFASVYFRNEDGSLESLFASHQWSVEMKSGDQFSLGGQLQVEDLRRTLFFPEDTEVPAGRYTFTRVQGSYRMNSGRLLRANASASAGSFYDGWRFEASFGPTWNASRHLELGGDYQFNRVRFPDRDAGFDVHLVRLRVQAALNTKVSANAFLQYNSSADLVSANVRFRYNFREGNDLWIVYNENLNTELGRMGPGPRLPLTDNRTILLKYTYTFGG